MKSGTSYIVGSCAIVAALNGANGFMLPSGGIAKAQYSGLSSSRGKDLPCSSSGSHACCPEVGARVVRQRQRKRHVLKAQMTQEEMALDQALIQRVAEEVEAVSGVELDQLINPAKVVNLERDLVKLRAALESGPGSERSSIEEEIAKKESTLFKEKRMVMQGWLKKVFVGQAVIATVLGGFMAYDQVPFFPDVDLSVQVLGFWFVWLFTVPSLRARKPGASEKVALDIAFLLTPVVSFAMPFITKDPVPIYWANIATLGACYGYGFTIGRPDSATEGAKNQPKWLKFVFKALDFGSGQERGVGGAARDRLKQDQND